MRQFPENFVKRLRVQSSGDHGAGADENPFDTYGLLLFCLFLGAFRVLAEWGIAGGYPLLPLADLLTAGGFLWATVFVFTAVLRLTVGQPWANSFPFALGMAAVIALPPFFDGLVAEGARYGVLWRFPVDWRWALYSPEAGVTGGTALAWWGVIVAAGTYTLQKSRSPVRAAAASAACYLGVAFLIGVLPMLAEQTRLGLAWPPSHRGTLLTQYHVLASLLAYFFLRPTLPQGLVRRIQHAFPFVMFCFVGAAFAGAVTASTFVYAFLLLLVFATALVQNDFHDAAEDGLQGRLRYVEAEDVRFMTVSMGLMIAALLTAGTKAALPLLVVLVLSMLYSYPFYRAKRWFPSNLKMEGMWGLSSFTLGIVAALEEATFGVPRWSPIPLPEKTGEALGAFDGMTLTAMLLVFGGYSLVAVLKDYKDWEADRSTGIQTVYTLAARRGWSLERVHTLVLSLSAVSLASAPLLLAVSDRIAWRFAPGGAAAGVLLWLLMAGSPSARRFKATLLLLTAFFLFLVLALSFSPGGEMP